VTCWESFKKKKDRKISDTYDFAPVKTIWLNGPVQILGIRYCPNLTFSRLTFVDKNHSR
jgi:hypothetical protein